MSIEHERPTPSDHRPHWSLVTSFWVAAAILLAALVLVFVVMHKPVWIELETLAAVSGALMSMFYSFVLYHGVYFSADETISLREPVGNPIEFGDFVEIPFGFITEAGASEGPIGLLLGFILDIIVYILLAFAAGLLLWLGVNMVLAGVIVVAVPAFYIFKRSVLFVMRHVAECHGKLTCALMYGFGYGVAKTVVLCLIVYGSHQFAELLRIAQQPLSQAP